MWRNWAFPVQHERQGETRRRFWVTSYSVSSAPPQSPPLTSPSPFFASLSSSPMSRLHAFPLPLSHSACPIKFVFTMLTHMYMAGQIEGSVRWHHILCQNVTPVLSWGSHRGVYFAFSKQATIRIFLIQSNPLLRYLLMSITMDVLWSYPLASKVNFFSRNWGTWNQYALYLIAILYKRFRDMRISAHFSFSFTDSNPRLWGTFSLPSFLCSFFLNSVWPPTEQARERAWAPDLKCRTPIPIWSHTLTHSAPKQALSYTGFKVEH